MENKTFDELIFDKLNELIRSINKLNDVCIDVYIRLEKLETIVDKLSDEYYGVGD
ncbi:MAG: hypothetical protein V4509_01745 [Patescibacteria group bacterium]